MNRRTYLAPVLTRFMRMYLRIKALLVQCLSKHPQLLPKVHQPTDAFIK